MTVCLLFFSQIRDVLGREEERLDLPSGSRVNDLERLLSTHAPQIAGLLGSVTFAVNNAYVDRDSELHDGDVVALISPISGG